MTDTSGINGGMAGESLDLKLRVLYIEDDPINRLVVRDMLSVVGIENDDAVDGPSGLAKFDEGQFDLVLLDLRMPGMDGFEVLRRIRARGDEKAQVPVVVITADTGVGIARDCMEAGAQETMLKPIAMQPMLDAICRHVLASNSDLGMI